MTNIWPQELLNCLQLKCWKQLLMKKLVSTYDKTLKPLSYFLSETMLHHLFWTKCFKFSSALDQSATEFQCLSFWRFFTVVRLGMIECQADNNGLTPASPSPSLALFLILILTLSFAITLIRSHSQCSCQRCFTRLVHAYSLSLSLSLSLSRILTHTFDHQH